MNELTPSEQIVHDRVLELESIITAARDAQHELKQLRNSCTHRLVTHQESMLITTRLCLICGYQ